MIVNGLPKKLRSVIVPLTLCGWVSPLHFSCEPGLYTHFCLKSSPLTIFKWPKFSRTQYLYYCNRFLFNDLDLAMKITMSFSWHKLGTTWVSIFLLVHSIYWVTIIIIFFSPFLLLQNTVPKNFIPQSPADAEARSHCFSVHANKETPNPSSILKTSNRAVSHSPKVPTRLAPRLPISAQRTLYRTSLPFRPRSPGAQVLQVVELMLQPFDSWLCCSFINSHTYC